MHVDAIVKFPDRRCGVTQSVCSLNPLALPNGITSLIFRWSLPSSHPTSRGGLAQTIYPSAPTPVLMLVIILNYMHPRWTSSTLPCHCSIHQHRIYFNCKGMHLLKRLVSSSTISLGIFLLGHIKAMTRVPKVLSKGIQLRLPTLITTLVTAKTERALLWKVMRIHVRAWFRIGISWPKNSLWRPRNLVTLGIFYNICSLIGNWPYARGITLLQFPTPASLMMFAYT